MCNHLEQFPAQLLWDLMIVKAKRGESSIEMKEALKKKITYKWGFKNEK